MSTAILIKQTDTGRRGVPMDLEEVQKLVQQGKAYRHHANIYEMKLGVAEEATTAEDSKPEVAAGEGDEYATKVMKPRTTRRKRKSSL